LAEIASARAAQALARESAANVTAHSDPIESSRSSRMSEAHSERELDSVLSLSDPLVQAIVDLRSGDAARIRKALAREEIADVALAAHVIPLLVRDDIARRAQAFLESLAPRCAGTLVDALLDRSVDIVIRRRLSRPLVATRSPRAAEGLVLALADEDLIVREQSARALARLSAENSSIVLSRDVIFDIAQRELTREDGYDNAFPRALDDASERDERLLMRSTESEVAFERRLEHALTLLSVVLPRDTLRLAHLALGSRDQALRGTAIEYLDTVLPDRLRIPLGRILGKPMTIPAERRSEAEIVDTLWRVVLRRSRRIASPMSASCRAPFCSLRRMRQCPPSALHASFQIRRRLRRSSARMRRHLT
jgi:hypothetical protein